MRIVFVGAGAVGGYFGGRMAQAGLDVSFLLRPASAQALQLHGLRITSPLGDFSVPKPRVLGGSGQQGVADVLFLACRADQVRAAAPFARGLVGNATLVIPLQNGVDAPGALCDVYEPERVLGGLSRIFAERISVGNILHMAGRPSITYGEREGGASPRVQQVLDVLSKVDGMVIDISDDIWTEMWKKLLMVCSVGAVGAASRAPLDILLGVPETRGLLVASGNEIAAVARTRGAQVPGDYAARQIGLYERLPPRTTASMHRDLERGDPSELEEQLGVVCRYGAQEGIATPVLSALYAALLPGELRARERRQFENVGPRPSG